MENRAQFPSLIQIIRGKLERVGVRYDEIEVLEEEDLRESYISTFNVRVSYGGYQRSLGLWRINIMEGRILGIAESRDSLARLQSFEQYESRLSYFKDEEKILRKVFYGPLARMVNRFSVENVQSSEQLLYPTNYIRKAVNSSIHKTVKTLFGIEMSQGALEALKERLIALRRVFSDREMNEAEQTIHRLAFYCAVFREASEILEVDVFEAARFYETLLHASRRRFQPSGRVGRVELADSPLYEAFYNWRPFSRLQGRLKTPESLVSLLIDLARIQYVLDEFPSKLDEKSRAYLEMLKEEFSSG